MRTESSFWTLLQRLVAQHPIVIDRPRGSRHPRYPDFIYPLDYGYLKDTRSGDGSGIDVWVGSLVEREVTGALVTVDAEKGDVEIKVLIGCTPAEMEMISEVHNSGGQAAMLLRREE
jgi:inorganic pyrophosphatase